MILKCPHKITAEIMVFKFFFGKNIKYKYLDIDGNRRIL